MIVARQYALDVILLGGVDPRRTLQYGHTIAWARNGSISEVASWTLHTQGHAVN